MSVVWGGYRSGVDGVSPHGGGYTTDGFMQNVAKGTERVRPELKVGRNAYVSEPLSAYFQQHFR